MNNKLIPALFVLLLTPGLLFAARPSVSAQEQALNILVDALVVCPPNSATRFVDNGDGTICDHQTGLMWEKKDADDSTTDFTNPHDVNNQYTWTDTADGDNTNPDGTVFTDFLARLNGELAGSIPSEQLGGYSDWRLPTSAELQALNFEPNPCSIIPCIIDPIFSPNTRFSQWSSTTHSPNPFFVWGTHFGSFSGASENSKSAVILFVRAVRGGR